MATAAQDLLDDFEALVEDRPGVDRPLVYARLRAELPVFFSERLQTWVVTRYDDVVAVLRDEERFGVPREGAGSPAFGRSFLQLSGREHHKKMGIVSRQMRSPRALRERLDGLVEEIAERQAATLPFEEAVDLKERYAMWIPLLAIGKLTGIDQAERLRSWYRVIVAGGVSSITNPAARDAAMVARTELRAFLAPIIAERRQCPGDDLVSDLVTAEYDGEPLPEEEIGGTIVNLLAAGVETTERVLTSAFQLLARDRDEWDVLRGRRGDPAALAAFAVECLRCFSPVNVSMRAALVPAELGGETIPPGDKVALVIGSANRDETHFDEPDRFERDRFAAAPDRQFTAGGDVLPFGAGTHFCAGARLAQVELVYGLAKLLERVAWLEPAGEQPAGEGFVLYSPPAAPVVLHAA